MKNCMIAKKAKKQELKAAAARKKAVEQNFKELDKKIQQLVGAFGHRKCTLKYSRDEDGTEGIWCVPASQKDADLFDNDKSEGEMVHLYLCNQPLGWARKNWGHPFFAWTRGELRPEAQEFENML